MVLWRGTVEESLRPTPTVTAKAVSRLKTEKWWLECLVCFLAAQKIYELVKVVACNPLNLSMFISGFWNLLMVLTFFAVVKYLYYTDCMDLLKFGPDSGYTGEMDLISVCREAEKQLPKVMWMTLPRLSLVILAAAIHIIYALAETCGWKIVEVCCISLTVLLDIGLIMVSALFIWTYISASRRR